MRFVFFLLIFCTVFLNASNLLSISKTQNYENFSIDYFKDNTSNLNIDEIQNKNFIAGTSNFNLGYLRNTAVWFKIVIQNKIEEENFIFSLNEHFYEVADLYYKSGNQQTFIKKSNSVFIPVEKREVKSTNLSFKIPIPSNNTTTIFLKIKGKYAYFGNITISPQSDYGYNTFFNIHTYFVFYFGISLIILVFSLFLFIRLRERIYGFYFGYAFFNLFYSTHMSGLLGYIDLEEYIYKFQFSAIFTVTFLLLFSMEYLETKKYLPRVHKFFLFLPLPLFTIGILSIFWYQPWNQFISNGVMLISIFLLIASIRIYFGGHTKSKYYVLALILYFIGVIIFVLMIKGNIDYTLFTRYAMFVIMPIEITIFTLMLADRYTEMKNITINIQNKLIKEKNIYQTKLEAEVQEQTKELKSLLGERELLLNEVNHRVKNNFHMLIGMLWMEDNKRDKKIHTELINRIKSLSRLHENLYNSKNIDKVDVKEYLEDVIQNIKIAYQKKNFSINYTIDEDINVTFEQALSLGVILNELLTNSFVHNSSKDSLEIDFKFIKEEFTKFVYKDTGCGFDINTSNKGLGVKIIQEFIGKIAANDYKFKTKNGVDLTFILKEHCHEIR